jgi:2-oxo-4-hydroxy-4-carboxy-5-ureidoimidazoline decarboxylase
MPGTDSPPIPEVSELNALSADAFAAALAPLFEGAMRFLVRVAEQRPFDSDAELLAAAHEVAISMPEEERVELVEAHPRIGADVETVSALSRDEQGFDDEAEDDTETARAYEELAMLNEIYERQFGFRYVVFVAGRAKADIVPLLEHALRNDRDAELRRALDETVDIAADRLARLREEASPGKTSGPETSGPAGSVPEGSVPEEPVP